MDKNNGIIITLSIIFGGLFAWIMGYTEWWQWLLSIIVIGVIVYLIVGIFLHRKHSSIRILCHCCETLIIHRVCIPNYIVIV